MCMRVRGCRIAILQMVSILTTYLIAQLRNSSYAFMHCFADSLRMWGGAGLLMAQKRVVYMPVGLAASVALTSAGFTLQTVGLKDGNSLVVRYVLCCRLWSSERRVTVGTSRISLYFEGSLIDVVLI